MFQTRSVTDPPQHIKNKVNATLNLQNIHGTVGYISTSAIINQHPQIEISLNHPATWMNSITCHTKKPEDSPLHLGSPDTSQSFLPIVLLRSWAERTLHAVEPVSQRSGRCFWNLQLKLFPIHNMSQPSAWFFVRNFGWFDRTQLINNWIILDSSIPMIFFKTPDPPKWASSTESCAKSAEVLAAKHSKWSNASWRVSTGDASA